MNTRETILQKAKELYSQSIENFSMRQLADSCTIGISVLYYYFKNKDELLKIAFDTTNSSLGIARRSLPPVSDPRKQLWQRIEFQFEHAQDVMFVLKYFMANRTLFEKNATGYIPAKGHLHISEVLEEGIKKKMFKIADIDNDAKVIAHAINGFILEYFPDIPVGKKRKKIVDMIADFLLRAIMIESFNNKKITV